MRKFVLILVILPLIAFAQSVKGTFSPAEDFTYAFLYKSTPEGADYVNRGKLDSIGSFEIALDSTATPGIYKIVYAIPAEEHNFDFLYDGKETVDFTFSTDAGVEFTKSDENKLWNSYLKSIDMVNQTISNYYSKDNADKKGFKSIFKVLKDTQLAYEESAKGKLVSTFIAANRPYIPTEYESILTYSSNLKKQYLSTVDFSNELLQSSSFLTDRVKAYVFNMVHDPSDETYKSHVDDIAAAIGSEDLKIKTSLLHLLWQGFVSMDNHDLANYIADQYLIDLAKTSKNKVLSETLTSYKNTSIGTKAPDFDISIKEEKSSLHQLEGAKHYLLIFWSSGCSHCLDELPQVKALSANHPNLKVVAFGLENGDKDWSKEIENYPNFTHVIGLGKWENPTVKTYGIAATPTYFLLDAFKVIIAKPYDYDELEIVLKDL